MVIFPAPANVRPNAATRSVLDVAAALNRTLSARQSFVRYA